MLPVHAMASTHSAQAGVLSTISTALQESMLPQNMYWCHNYAPTRVALQHLPRPCLGNVNCMARITDLREVKQESIDDAWVCCCW